MKTISAKEIIKIVEESDLDKTIKDILVRDIKAGGVTDFLVDQVIAYCDNAIAHLNKKAKSPA